jgi:hypothetical protein
MKIENISGAEAINLVMCGMFPWLSWGTRTRWYCNDEATGGTQSCSKHDPDYTLRDAPLKSLLSYSISSRDWVVSNRLPWEKI